MRAAATARKHDAGSHRTKYHTRSASRIFNTGPSGVDNDVFCLTLRPSGAYIIADELGPNVEAWSPVRRVIRLGVLKD
jgi:hypothetical protein